MLEEPSRAGEAATLLKATPLAPPKATLEWVCGETKASAPLSKARTERQVILAIEAFIIENILGCGNILECYNLWECFVYRFLSFSFSLGSVLPESYVYHSLGQIFLAKKERRFYSSKFYSDWLIDRMSSTGRLTDLEIKNFVRYYDIYLLNFRLMTRTTVPDNNLLCPQSPVFTHTK